MCFAKILVNKVLVFCLVDQIIFVLFYYYYIMRLLLLRWAFCALCVCISESSDAQVHQNQPQISNVSQLQNIQVVYGESWMDSNPDMVSILEFCLNNRITYLIESGGEFEKYPLLSSFPLMNKVNNQVTGVDYTSFDPHSFNPLTYSLPFLSDLKQVIRVDGTNYLIVIDPYTKN